MSFFYSFLTTMLFSLNLMTEIPYAGIESAFSDSNASGIVSYGKDKILLNVLGNEGVYSQSQAALVLKDFFNKKPITSFKFMFKGKETADGSFAIGTYVSKTESFRVTIQFKKSGNDFKIESLTIEKS
ncbi:MAG: DUF4783 domain-containing protein [Flavobacteriia bacterium]|nr:DUF4783 domain-containing protein [Flavobacteriia bacterium]